MYPAGKCSVLRIFAIAIFTGCGDDPAENPPAGDPPGGDVANGIHEGYGTSIPVPPYAQRTIHTLAEMRTLMLPAVETHHRTPEKQALIDEIAAVMESAAR